MTLNDFVRNQRGLNNKADFPRDFLEGIYNAIKTREIVMPEEQSGDLKEDYEWKVLEFVVIEFTTNFLIDSSSAKS